MPYPVHNSKSLRNARMSDLPGSCLVGSGQESCRKVFLSVASHSLDLNKLTHFVVSRQFCMLMVCQVHLALRQNVWFIVVDLKNTYWQIPIHLEILGNSGGQGNLLVQSDASWPKHFADEGGHPMP